MRAGFEFCDVLQLLFGDLFFSADGRVNVNSKRAPDHQRNLELGEFLQVHRNSARGGGVQVHADGAPEIFRVQSPNAHAAGNAAEGAFHEPEEEAGQQASLMI